MQGRKSEEKANASWVARPGLDKHSSLTFLKPEQSFSVSPKSDSCTSAVAWTSLQQTVREHFWTELNETDYR